MIADKQVEYIDFGFDQSVQSLNKLAQQPCSESDEQTKITEISEISEIHNENHNENHNEIHSEIHSLDDEDKFEGIGSFPNRNKRKSSTACIR